jgi:hypothetical protein
MAPVFLYFFVVVLFVLCHRNATLNTMQAAKQKHFTQEAVSGFDSAPSTHTSSHVLEIKARLDQKDSLPAGEKSVVFPGVWEIIEDTLNENNVWKGTVNFNGEPLREGLCLSRTHSDIVSIVDTLRAQHETELLTKQRTTYDPTCKYVRLVCFRHIESTHKEARERSNRTQRHVPGENEMCPVTINLIWTKKGVTQGWYVGKMHLEHCGHMKPQQPVVKLTAEQRQLYGEQMVDASLSAAQVLHMSSCLLHSVWCACYQSELLFVRCLSCVGRWTSVGRALDVRWTCVGRWTCVEHVVAFGLRCVPNS